MKALLLAGMLALAGCKTLGLAPAQTLDQKLEYAYSGVDAALKTIVIAVQDGTLSSTKAAQANAMTLAVKTSLDAARAAEGTDAASAQNDLAMATSALTALQTFLIQNGAK